MSKTFRLAPADLKPIAEGHGMGVATSRITVDGQPVGHMYREAPAFANDSGWRFTAGTESDAYGRNPDNWDVIDVNLIANLDAAIVPYLGHREGSAFVSWPLGAPLRPVEEVTTAGTSPAAGAAPAASAAPGRSEAASGIGTPAAGFAVIGVQGDEQPVATAVGPEVPQHQALSRDWWIDLPGPFTGFLSSGALQLVSVHQPPRRIWVDIRNAADGGQVGVAAMMVKDIRLAARPSGAAEYEEPGTDPGEHRVGFWFEEHREGERGYWTLYTYTVRDASFVQAAFLSTTPDPGWALAAWRSLRYRPGTGTDWEVPTPDEE